MTGIEVTLLIIGAIIFAASFIFSSKSDSKAEANYELSNKQKEDMKNLCRLVRTLSAKNQILSIFDEQMESLAEKTEIQLDKMSNEKMNEMNEYSETILGEINRNHNEVMFLYDMLNEKKKEINNTVRDLNAAKKELAQETKKVAEVENEDIGFMASEAIMNNEKASSAKSKSKKETVLDQLDAVSETVSDDVEADVQAEAAKPKRKRTNNAKTAAERARTTVKKETVREENKDITVFENGNNNEKILELSRAGKTNVEIAKTLGLGIGEVKLVVDLFKGGK